MNNFIQPYRGQLEMTVFLNIGLNYGNQLLLSLKKEVT